MDSYGLRAIVLAASQGSVTIVDIQPRLRRIFEISALDHLIGPQLD